MPEHRFQVGDIFTITPQYAERLNAGHPGSVIVGQVYRVDQRRDGGPMFWDENQRLRSLHEDGMRHHPEPPPPPIDVGYEIELVPARRQDRVRNLGDGTYGLRRRPRH